jgi:hypothetical protein
MRDRLEIYVIDYVGHGLYDGVGGISLSAAVSRDRKSGGGVIEQDVKNSKL